MFAKSQLETHAISPRFVRIPLQEGLSFLVVESFYIFNLNYTIQSIKTDNLIIIHICLPLKIKILKTDLLVRFLKYNYYYGMLTQKATKLND